MHDPAREVCIKQGLDEVFNENRELRARVKELEALLDEKEQEVTFIVSEDAFEENAEKMRDPCRPSH